MTAKLEDTWIQFASRLDPAKCGIFLLSLCKYQTDSIEPDLDPELKTVFDLIRPELDRLIAKRKAQKASVNKRLACKRSANGLQTPCKTSCKTSANDLQTPCKNPTPVSPSSPASSPSLSPNNTPTQPGTNAPAPDARKIDPITFADRLPRHLRTPEVMAKWREWEDFRRRIKGKKISVMAASRQIAMLASYEPDQAIAIIEQSITNDYQGLFPLKGVKPRTQSSKPI